MERKIGTTQIEVLKMLSEHGRWADGCGWTWSTKSNTERIMESLVKRGLAERTGTIVIRREVMGYAITEAGTKAVCEVSAWHRLKYRPKGGAQ